MSYFFTPQTIEAGPPCANAVVILPRPPRPDWAIEAPLFEMSGQTLEAYQMPITKIIEDNTVKDIQQIEEREFLRAISNLGEVIG